MKPRPTRGRSAEAIAVMTALLAVVASLTVASYVMMRGEGAARDEAALPSEAAPAKATSTLLTDAQAFMSARRVGPLLVGMAAREGGPVELYVYGEEELPLSDGVVRVSVDGGPRAARRAACGRGCFRIDATPFTGAVTTIEVAVAPPAGQGGAVVFTLPPSLPPTAAAVLRRAKRTMLGVRTLRIEEALTAGGATVSSSWSIQAPDRLSVTSSDGGATVLIGAKRWDLIDGSWREDRWDGSRQPRYAWEGARNARLLGRASLGGVAVSRLAAFTPDPEPWWFTLWVAKDGRVLKVEMLAASHFMTDRYLDIDRPVSIEPPL